ncbi:MAG: hypothetical protein AUG49_06360 [Catenulispora sp. 13_1_20CM_3_70_7]|nr:MAG: hypothetical protein AUG49_06360 [Catenulispora sp. 13_1_20CM_3_70_7]
MTRPTDWSALGLSSDPTPGDQSQVQDVYNLLHTLATDYQTILDTINTVNGYADSGNLTGATAEALRQQMNGRITNFVKSAQEAFSQAAPAINTYLSAMTQHQATADGLLTKAQNSGLKATDPTVKSWATQAKQAGTDLQTASDAAVKVIHNLPGPSDPLSPWEEFLKILGWIALLLILPAMIFGGVIALVEFVVNAILFVNALVEFAQGNLSVGGLLLAALGIIAPTTRALSLGDIVDVIKGIGSFIKTGILNVRAGLNDFIALLTVGKLSSLVSLDTLVGIGNFALKAGLWVFNGIKDLPSTAITAGTAFAVKLGELFSSGAVKIVTNIKTGAFLSLVLPVSAVEVEKLGLVTALRLGFIDRGLGITAAPAVNLADLNKLALKGIGTGTYHFEGFSHLDAPRISTLDVNIGKGLRISLPNVDVNVGMSRLDLHLEAPDLSVGNLAAGFQHGSLEIGTISTHIPNVNFHLNGLEIPDLRYPKELNNIGNGTTVVHMSDISLVVVHDDKLSVPPVDTGLTGLNVTGLHGANLSIPTIHTGDLNVSGLHTGDLSVPALHTGDLSLTALHTGNPSIVGLHTGDLSIPALHTGDATTVGLHTGGLNLPALHQMSVPNQGTTLGTHITSGGLHTSVPSLHTTELNASGLKPVDLTSATTSFHPSPQDLPNLAAIAHTKIDIAQTHGLAIQHTDAGLKIDSTLHPADTVHVDTAAGTSITAVPHTEAFNHLSTPSLDAAAPHLSTPALDAPRTLQANPELGAHVTVTDAGIHTQTHVAEVSEATVHTETSIPTVSSAGLDEAAAHSAGTRGGPALEPDLAGAPGLLDPNAERVAVAWTDFKQAQFQHGAALGDHDVRFAGADPKPGEASVAFNGKAPMTDAQAYALHDLGVATEALNSAAGKLHDLGVNPLRLGLKEHSDLTAELNSAPKLLGGSRSGDKAIAVDPVSGRPTLSTRPLGLDHQLVIIAGQDHEFGGVVNVHTGQTDFGGRLTELDPHGGFRLDSTGGDGAFREYQSNGTIHAEGLTLTDHTGAHWGEIAVHADGTADLRWLGRPALTDLRFEDLGEGGFRVSGSGGRQWTFDWSGAITHDRTRFTADPAALLDVHPLGPNRQLVITVTEGHQFGEVVDIRSGEAGFGGRLSPIGDNGAFRIDSLDPRGGFRGYSPDGTVLVEGHDVFDRRGDLLGEYGEFSDGAVQFSRPGELVRGLRFEPLDGGGFRLTESAGWRTWEFDAHGVQTYEPLQLTDHLGNPTIAVHIDHLGGTAHTYHADGTDEPWTFTPDADGSGGFRLGVDEPGVTAWTGYDARGRLTGWGNPLQHWDGHVLGDIEFGARPAPQPPTVTIVRADGTSVRPAGVATDGGDRTLITLPDGSVVEVLDQTTRTVITHAELHVRLPGGGDLNAVHVDFARGTADFRAPGLADQTWHFQHDTQHEGFTLVGQDGVHTLHFNADNELRFSLLTTRDPVNGGLHDVHIATDHGVADPNIAHTVVDGNGVEIPGFRATRTVDGHFGLTDLRPGHGHDSFVEFDGVTGAVRNERVNLQGENLQAHVDHLAQDGPAVHIPDGGPGRPPLSVVRDPDTGGLRVTGLNAAHPNDFKTFDAGGIKTGERITITDRKGRPLGNDEHFAVTGLDGDRPTWIRQDTGGQIRPLMQHPDGAPHINDARLGSGYNSSGVVKVRNDGTLILEGEDKTPAFTREPLANGVTIEVLRLENGSRRWTTWDTHGKLTGSGIRRFSTEDGGVTSWDLDNLGRTIRQYRVAIDGGLIRTENVSATEVRWTRFTADGSVTGLSGTRVRPLPGLAGWRDPFTRADGTSVDAQRYWSKYHLFSGDMHWRPFTHADHYREYKISPVPDTPGAFRIDSSYKEISAQGKDTGSLEKLANNHTIEFTRYSEQRVPDFLWKTPGNLPDGFSKVIAKSYLGSKWGAVDFPAHGVVFGDSRFQVFKWVEKNGDGAIHSEGVRVVTPDGSFSDFAGDGLFVRGAIKLDNGHTVEIGRDPRNAGKWDTFQVGGDGTRPAPTLNWHQLGSDKKPVGPVGIREFNGKQWRDTYTGADGTTFVVRYTKPNGDVVHFTGADKPHLDAGGSFLGLEHGAAGDTRVSITRNTMGQIVERTDQWGHWDGAVTTHVTGKGDPRTGNWKWEDDHLGGGVRISGRNTPFKGSWDDSYGDFRTTVDGQHFQIRDFRALDKGTSLRAERLPDGTWTSAKYDFEGRPIDGTQFTREWKDAGGVVFQPRPGIFKNPKLAEWRDVNSDGVVIRELIDGKVREYTDVANGAHTWKEYNFGSVWRERKPLSGHPNLFLEKENFQKQWRVTNINGDLLRYRSITGNILERNAFGQWKLVGSEREGSGLFSSFNAFRGISRETREPNRIQFTVADGAVGSVRGQWSMIAEKTVLDFLQDFAIDVGANVIITGALNGWNFNAGQIGGFFAGAAIRSGVKAGYGIATETVLKNFRDGLRNLDGGKDFNRQPYNNDKHWGNEWAGNENPTRWRSGTFDYFAGNVAVPAVGSFLATLAVGSSFGFGKDGIVLHGGDLVAAAGLNMAGSVVGGLTFGAIRTMGHVGLSGRWFHQGGMADITLQFGERLATNFLINHLLAGASGLSGGGYAKGVAGGEGAGGGGADNPEGG